MVLISFGYVGKVGDLNAGSISGQRFARSTNVASLLK
jgi:hypothetical protein